MIGRNSTDEDPIAELHASQLAILRTAADYPHFSADDINMIIGSYRNNYTLTRNMDPNDVEKELKKAQALPDNASPPEDLSPPPDHHMYIPPKPRERHSIAGPNSPLIAHGEPPSPSSSNFGRG